MTDKFISQKWRSFEFTVLQGKSRVQRVEMRKAFYAGAAAFFDVLTANVPEDESDFSLMDSLKKELLDFARTGHRD